MFEFYWPWFWLLLPLPLVIQYFWRPAVRQLNPVIAPFHQSISALKYSSVTSAFTVKKVSFRHICLWLIWIALLSSASNPRWSDNSMSIPISGRDLMIAVDLSGSMEVEDMILSNQPTNRLNITRFVVNQFVEQRKGDRIGLIFFGSQAYLQAPLTFDIKTVQTFMDEAHIGMAGKYTAIGDAIGLAVKQLQKNPEYQRVLVLLTDGANTTGAIMPEQAIEIAKKMNVKIYSIGIGADEIIQPSLFGARKINPSALLDENLLENAAQLTGGKYFRARNTSELEEAYHIIENLEPIELDSKMFRPYKSFYFWPLAIAMTLSLLLAIGFIKPRLFSIIAINSILLRLKLGKGEKA